MKSGARLWRRTFLRGAATAGLGVATAAVLGRSTRVAEAAHGRNAVDPAWRSFDDAVRAAMPTFDMIGAAVAIVSRDGIRHSQTFGARDRATGAPVTPQTLFRVGSTTKSMTALLVATFVDQGLIGWDEPPFDTAGALRLHVGGRAVRVLSMPDGSYVGASGQLAGTPTLLARDQNGTPALELADETVRWLTGPS